jgi:hypothetical protein
MRTVRAQWAHETLPNSYDNYLSLFRSRRTHPGPVAVRSVETLTEFRRTSTLGEFSKLDVPATGAQHHTTYVGKKQRLCRLVRSQSLVDLAIARPSLDISRAFCNSHTSLQALGLHAQVDRLSHAESAESDLAVWACLLRIL